MGNLFHMSIRILYANDSILYMQMTVFGGVIYVTLESTKQHLGNLCT